MTEESARLRMPYLSAAQAQKHVTHNEALTLLDTLVQLAVLDKDLAAPPASPSEGDCYIVAAGATGDWTGWEKRVVRFIDGIWRSYLPGAGSGAGWLAWVMDEDAMYRFDGTGWALAGIEGPPGPTGATGPAGASSLTICRLVATADLDLATELEAGDTVDGVTLAQGDRVLVAGQSDASQNGVYLVPASGAASRDPDFDAFDEHPGVYFSVMEGAAKADTLWRCTSDRGGTLGSSALAIAEFGAGGGGATLASPGVHNGKLAASRIGGAETYALKTLAGADPWSGDPVVVKFPDGVQREVTGPLSITLPSGATLGFAAGVTSRVWAALVDDGGTVRIAVRNCSDGGGVSGFPAKGALNSSLIGTGSDNVKWNYTNGAAVTAKPYVIAAYFDYDGGLATPGTWDVAPAITQWHAGSPKPGDEIQRVYATQSPNDNITSPTYAATSSTLAIQPQARANKIEVSVFASGDNGTSGNVTVAARLSRGTTNNSGLFGPQIQCGYSSFIRSGITLCGLDHPATASSQTYAVQVLSSGGTARWTNGVPLQWKIVEILG